MSDLDMLSELIKTRRSVREFTDRVPEKAQIEKLIEAAQWAPSNHNRQGWKFIVFQNGEHIKQMAQKIRQSLKATLTDAHRLAKGHSDELIHYAGAFDKAPVVILAMHKKSPAVGRKIVNHASTSLASGEALSTAMATQNLILTAHAMGLATCVMTAPLLAGDFWKNFDDLPMGFETNCIIALGYPANTPQPPRRKKIEHIVEYR